MIQFRRGSTTSWSKFKKPLADGQPGYDKTKNKLKIGNGKDLWDQLPDASGLTKAEILCSETDAQKLKKQNSENTALITYGDKTPSSNMAGEIYLQYSETEPEVDYVVDSGIDGIWSYQKWKSGKVTCSGTYELKSISVDNIFEGAALYYDSNKMDQIQYPFIIKGISLGGTAVPPTEVATLHNSSGSDFAWLASRVKNSTKQSGAYNIISLTKQNSTTYTVSILVEGFWE